MSNVEIGHHHARDPQHPQRILQPPRHPHAPAVELLPGALPLDRALSKHDHGVDPRRTDRLYVRDLDARRARAAPPFADEAQGGDVRPAAAGAHPGNRGVHLSQTDVAPLAELLRLKTDVEAALERARIVARVKTEEEVPETRGVVAIEIKLHAVSVREIYRSSDIPTLPYGRIIVGRHVKHMLPGPRSFGKRRHDRKGHACNRHVSLCHHCIPFPVIPQIIGTARQNSRLGTRPPAHRSRQDGPPCALAVR